MGELTGKNSIEVVEKFGTFQVVQGSAGHAAYTYRPESSSTAIARLQAEAFASGMRYATLGGTDDAS